MAIFAQELVGVRNLGESMPTGMRERILIDVSYPQLASDGNVLVSIGMISCGRDLRMLRQHVEGGSTMMEAAEVLKQSIIKDFTPEIGVAHIGGEQLRLAATIERLAFTVVSEHESALKPGQQAVTAWYISAMSIGKEGDRLRFTATASASPNGSLSSYTVDFQLSGDNLTFHPDMIQGTNIVPVVTPANV